MASRPNRKRKRPLAEGVVRPPKRPRRPKGWEPAPRTVLRTALVTALGAPVLIVGLMAVGTNPDYLPVCAITAVLVLMGSLIATMLVRAKGWLLWPAVALGVLMLALPTTALRAQLIEHRGERTAVVITAAHRATDRSGRVSWSCDIRREDGLPLPHARFSGDGCSSERSVGQSGQVLVDPSGWVPPVSTGEDTSFSGAALWAVPGLAVLWAALILGAARRTLSGR
ncbi:hypothetical protein [Streptomyces sp. NRRL WC-3742]|uniref:hypothetical protein n=1 Tax=Streptomyces sp. NRRL WC-3742 TaxID=1463934 RepID=UPI0004C7FD3E|nr:hypothetical protein [Streptomyces sp. NRRL WC-3742]